MTEVRLGEAHFGRTTLDVGAIRLLPPRSNVREQSAGGLRSVLMRTPMEPWDHEEFQDYVVKHAYNQGIEGRNELSHATNIKLGTLSKWYRGVERPSPELLQRLAEVIRVPYIDLLILTGRIPQDDGPAITQPRETPKLHRLAREINDMLATDSPLPRARRAFLAESLDRLIDPDRPAMQISKKSA